MSEKRADKNIKKNFSKRDFRNQEMERDDDNDADDEMSKSTNKEFGAVSMNVIRKGAQASTSIAHLPTPKPFNLYAYRTSTSRGSDSESDESENSSSPPRSDPESGENVKPLATRTIPDSSNPSSMIDAFSSVLDSLCVDDRPNSNPHLQSSQSEQNALSSSIAHDVLPWKVSQPSVSTVPERGPRLPRLPPSVPTIRVSPHNYNLSFHSKIPPSTMCRSLESQPSVSTVPERGPRPPRLLPSVPTIRVSPHNYNPSFHLKIPPSTMCRSIESVTAAIPLTSEHRLRSASRQLLSDWLSQRELPSPFDRMLKFKSVHFDQNYSLPHQSVSGSMDEFDPNNNNNTDEDISTIGTGRSSSTSISNMGLSNSSSNQYELQTPIPNTSRHQDSTKSSSTNQCESSLSSGVMRGSITPVSAYSLMSEYRDGKERSVKDQTTDSLKFDLANLYNVVPPNRTVKDINTPVVSVHSQSTSATSSQSVPDPEPTRSSTPPLASPSISTTGSAPAKKDRKPMSFQEFLDATPYEPIHDAVLAINAPLARGKRRLEFDDSEQPSGEITEVEAALFKEKEKLDEDERDEKRSGRKRRSNQPTEIPPDSENDEAKSKRKRSLSQPEQTVDSESLDDSGKKV